MKELSKLGVEAVLAGKALPGELLVGESLAKYFARLYMHAKESRDAQIAAIDSGLSTLAGAMLNRTLDSGSKQAVAYAECADMVAKFAKQLREGK